MKTKSKALAIISALMLFIVILSGFYPVKVSAAESGYEVQLGNCTTGYSYTGDTINAVRDYAKEKGFSNGKLISPYVGIYSKIDGKTLTYFYDFSDPLQAFKSLCYSLLSEYNTSESYYGKPIYFVFYYGTIGVSSDYGYYCILSYEKINLVSDSDGSSYFQSENNADIYLFRCKYTSTDRSFTPSYKLFSKNTKLASSSFFSYSENKELHFRYDADSINDISLIDVYSNIAGLSLPDGSTVSNFPGTTSLKSQIDVKLTPEFGLDMDRVFDKNTGQNDYFKFEVTNNSNKNIQFCASIVDEAGDFSFEDFFEGTILDGIFQDYISEWEESYWNYIIDNQHYVDFYREDDKKFFGLFQGNITRYAELQKGNFYWVLLKPGEHLEDYIYWENVKINPKKKYSFIVDCIPTELDYPTDIFYSMQGDNKIFSHPEEINDKNYNRDSTLEHYAINAEDTIRACNYVFSVMSMPDFTSTIKGGNSKITSGWNDTVAQSSNPYYRKDLTTGDVVPVVGYSEFNGNLDDFNINIDNISPNNIMKYISFPKQFINLLKIFFTEFPSLWALIIFGITACVTIAIIRYIKG